MKRYLGVFMATVVFLNGIIMEPIAADETYNEYIIPLGSNQTNRKQIIGLSNQMLLEKGVVYIPIETACEIAGATVAAENDDAVIISRNYVSWCCEYDQTDNQYLLVERNTGKGTYFASVLNELVNPSFMTPKRLHNTSFSYSCLGDDVITLPVEFSYCTDIPCDYYNDELYVSFYEFLSMMGVQISTVNPTTHYDTLDSILSGLQLDLNQEDYETLLSTIMDAVYGNSNAAEMFICTLGTPIDALYREYYDLQKDTLICELSDFYTEWDIKWANLVNSAASFEGITETILASMNLNTDYFEILASILSKVKGDTDSVPSMPAKITNTLSHLWTLVDYGKATCDLKVEMGKVAKAASSQSIDISFGYDDAFECVLSAAEYYHNFQCLSTLYENDKTILADSILNSEYILVQCQ